MDLLALSSRAFMDERDAVSTLLAAVAPLASLNEAIMAQASAWTRDIRAEGVGHGVEAFLSAYGLNTEEGLALMCLAEALLRIPDSITADALIRDTFEGRAWGQYLGEGDSWMVNMSSWGLLFTGKFVDYTDAPNILSRVAARLGEPVIRKALKQAMRFIGGQFVLGESMEEALNESKAHSKNGYRFSYDILGEGARSDAQAQEYVDAYRDGIARIAATVAPGTPLMRAPGISVKLSALHARYTLPKKDRVMEELLPRLTAILAQARRAGITVAIDAEEATRLDIELMLFERLLSDPQFTNWNGIGFVAQAYQKRTFYVIDWLAELAKRTRRTLPLRLVKGAYWDSEIKWAQSAGMPGYPVFTRKENTDLSYLACADKMLRYGIHFYPQFATHNARTAASVLTLAKRYGHEKGSFEFQRLHGMGQALHNLLLEHAPSRIYAPVGPHKDLLAYLIRRLLENGANSSFVHLLMDTEKTPEEILADPVTAAADQLNKAPSLPLPDALYITRKNSRGIDFGNNAQLTELQQELAKYRNPVPPIKDIAVDALATALEQATPWNAPVEIRASILEKAADLIELHAVEFIALCAQEAGKILADGIAEVREAADFCRYYAAEARRLMSVDTQLTGPTGERNGLHLQPRGIFACISPWNFPLAIFIGQISAALAAGNGVLAKPAEQTPAIAQRAVELLHLAGVPATALQFTPGPGETTGAALVSHPCVHGVVFTGGTDTARIINRAISQRPGPIIPLIAETGGQNCMVVDSSALLEQAVDDIVQSAFGSAGQRCSALRILFVQEDIAAPLLALLSGAMQELRLGDPFDPATDIGPVIDAHAKAALEAHIAELKTHGRLIAAAPATTLSGHFVVPHAFEIPHIDILTREHFGPILHIVRFNAGTLAQVAQAINSTGYGLTFGLHSRIDEHIQFLTHAIHAGNIYVNRSMIGATVGVQPFGGEGLSGTGPKAGGPHYLPRFCVERTLTVNTAAIGGNTALLAGV